VISKENSTLIDGAVDGDGAGDADAIQARTTQTKARIEETSSDYDRRKPQERMANPAGGSARHQGRASTEIEIEEKVLRVEVALNVTRAVS
jgi:chaperonin GroEL